MLQLVNFNPFNNYSIDIIKKFKANSTLCSYLKHKLFTLFVIRLIKFFLVLRVLIL